jgi:hypothetical protein
LLLELKLENRETRRFSMELSTPQSAISGCLPVLRERVAYEFETRSPLPCPATEITLRVEESVPGPGAQNDFFSREESEAEAREAAKVAKREAAKAAKIAEALAVAEALRAKAEAEAEQERLAAEAEAANAEQTEADKKAARDARYAARKSRKGR